MMTNARKNRVWTPELRGELKREVEAITVEGRPLIYAFKKLEGKWGICHQTISSAYYYKGKEKASKVRTKDTGGGLPTNVVEAINVLKGLGISVTLSF